MNKTRCLFLKTIDNQIKMAYDKTYTKKIKRTL